MRHLERRKNSVSIDERYVMIVGYCRAAVALQSGVYICVVADNEEAKKEEDTAALIQEETRRYEWEYIIRHMK